MRSKLLLCILSSWITISLYGQSAGDYRSKQSGNWNNGANWERFTGVSWQAADAVPSSADGVITIAGGHNIAVNSTTIADQVVVDAGGALLITALLILNDGIGDDLTINGTLNFISSILYGPGNAVVAVGGTLNLTTGNLRWFGAHTTNNGTMNWNDGTTYFYNSTVLTNAGTFNITGNNLMTNENNATGIFINSGTMNKTSSGISRFSMSTVNNTGTINLNAGIVENQTNFTNSGTFQFNNGDFTHEINRVFNFNSGSVFTGTGGFTNNGTMNLNINLSFPSSIEFAVGGQSTTTGQGNLTINNTFTLNNDPSGGPGSIIDGSGSLTINANTNWNGGALKRPLTVRATDTLTLATTGVKLIYVPLINNGTMVWQNGTIYFKTNGVLLTNAATFNITGNNILLNEVGTSGTFVNNGTITKTSTAVTDLQVTAVNNTGTINLNGSGTLRKQPNPHASAGTNMFTNTGDLNFNGGNFINALNNIFNHNNGSTIGGIGNFTNDGTMNLNSNQSFPSTLQFTVGSSSVTTGPGNLTINSHFTMQIAAFEPGSLIDGTGSLTINANITWNGGMFRRPFTIGSPYTLNFATESEKRIAAAITNSGTMNWNGGTIRFSASVTLINAGNFNINGNHSMVNENFVTGAFVNAGLITKTSAGTSSFPISTFTNNSIGIIKGSGTFDINATFNNNGTIAPGLSPGILTMNNRQPFSINSTLSIEIAGNGGAGQPTGHDQLQRNGDLTLAGTLTVLETGTVPNGSYTIISLTSGTISGSFATTNLPAGYTLSQTSTTVVLTKLVAPSNYRSKQTGNWNLASTWERFDGVNWVNAITSPSSSDGIISIINAHQVTVTDARSADQLIVDADAILTVTGGAGTLTLDNGDGTDLTVNGHLNLSGTLIGSGIAQLNSSMNWTGGIVSVDLTITSTGTLTMSTSNTKTLLSKNIINQGTINWNDGNFNFSSAGLQNENIFNQTVDRPFNSLGVLDVFLNTVSGTFTKSAVGITNIDVGVTNRGTFKGTGTLSFNAAFTNTGSIAPGLSPGILTVNGSAPFSSNSTLHIEIMNANGAGTGHDQLQRAGNLTLAGILTVVETGIVPNGDYTIISLSSGTISGSFATTNLPAGYTLSQTSTTVVLTKQVVVAPSDYRSKQSGNWHLASTWERFDGTNWIDAVTSPSSSDKIITIVGTHQVSVLNSISADQLIVSAGATITIVATGTLTLDNGTGSDLTVNGTVNLSGGVLTGNGSAQLNGSMNWIGGIVSVDLTITSTGTLTMSTTNTKTLQAKGILNQGTINWNDGNFNFSNAALQNENVFNQTVDRPFNSLGVLDVFLNTVSGTFTKSAMGITNIDVGVTNRGTFKGTGTLGFNAAITNTGTIAPGLSPGILTVNGSAPFSSNSTLHIEIMNANGAGTGHDQLQRAGNLVLNGTLNVAEIGTVPAGDYTIIILTSGTISGTFSSTNLPPDYTIIYNTNSVVARKGQVTCTPAVSITAAPGNTICAGTNVTFTATPSNGGATPTYQWKLNGNNVGINSNIYSNIALANDDQVSVVMTSSAACASSITMTSNTITMTVGSSVPLSVSISANPGNTICAGTNVTFTATASNSVLFYQWSLNGQPGPQTSSNTYSNSALANGDQVSVVVVSATACSGPPFTAISNTITMAVTSVAPSVSIVTTPGPHCEGRAVLFVATPTNGGSPTYQWMLNGNNVGTNSSAYSSNSLVDGDEISCEMTSSLACASPNTATSNTVTMNMIAPVTPSVNISANPGNTICAGTTVTFTATPTNAGLPLYFWKLNGVTVATTNSNIYSSSTLANGDVVNCVMTSSLACVSSSSAASNSIPIIVTSTVTPLVSISANPGNTVCAGTNVTFTATPANGGETPSYQWKLNGTNVGTNSNVYSNNALANGDVVTVIMTSSLTCADPSSTTSNSMVMLVTSGGLNAGIVSIGNRHRCPQTLQANPGGDVSYQWYKDGLGIPGATERRYVANNNGKYSVRVTKNSCSVMSTETEVTSCLTIQTRINTNKEFTEQGLPPVSQNGLRLYPNPASDYVIIQLREDVNVNGEAIVQLVSLRGQVLLTQKLLVSKGKIDCKLKLNSLWPDELYLVKVIINKKIYAGKLIKINP